MSKQNKTKPDSENRNQTDGCQRGVGLGWCKGKGDTVNNITGRLHGDRRLLDLVW